MTKWYDASEPLTLKKGAKFQKEISLEVVAGTGTVEVQRLLPDGTTWAAAGSDSVLSEDDVYWIKRANGPAVRIVATGNAQFAVTGI